MNKKIIHPVTVERLEKIQGDIIILNGGRNTGKSYSVKVLMLREAFKAINKNKSLKEEEASYIEGVNKKLEV